MNTILLLTKSSLKMFLRNKQALFFTLVFPMIIMIIFGLIGFDKPPKFDIGLAVKNPQPQTRQMIDRLKSIDVFNITEGSLDAELAQLKNGDRVAVLSIPDDFLTMIAPAQPKELTIYINEGQQAQAQATVSIISQYLDKTTLAIVKAPALFTIKQEIVDSRHLKYIDFLLPGLIAMSVMQMSVFSVAFVFVQYKEKGVLKRLLATPMRPFDFVAANAITRLIVSVVQASIFILVGVLFLKATVVGSYWLTALCIVLGALMFLGLGFTVSGLATTVDTVPALANLLVFPQLFLGGVFFSISSMPHWLQIVAKFLPLTHFSTAIREVMTQDAGIATIKWDLLAMLAWSVVLIGLATYAFRFQEKDSG